KWGTVEDPLPERPIRPREDLPEQPSDETARAEPSEEQVVAWLDQLWRDQGAASETMIHEGALQDTAIKNTAAHEPQAAVVPFQIGPYDVGNAVGHGAFG